LFGSQRKGMRLVINVLQLSKQPLGDQTSTSTDSAAASTSAQASASASSELADSDEHHIPATSHFSRSLVFIGEKDVHTCADLIAFLREQTAVESADMWTHQV
jgi:hypothetical protein